MKSNYVYNGYRKVNTTILFKLSVAFIFLLCLDFIFGSVIKYFYFRQSSGPEFVTTFSIEKTNANLLIFGSSRANHHYHPGVFEEKLKMSCYNVGRDGFDIIYHYAVLKAILERYTPGIVILDITMREFLNKQDSYDKLSALLPYYKNHSEIRKIVDLKSNLEKFKMLSHIYPFNSTLSYIILGNTNYNQKRRNEINGYVPLIKIWKEPINTYTVDNGYELDPEKIRIFNAFIKDCCAANIKLYIILSPSFGKFNNVDKSIKIGQEIAQKYNVSFYDFTNDTVFINHPKLFEDEAHLNNEGAKIFSTMLINKIWRINQ